MRCRLICTSSLPDGSTSGNTYSGACCIRRPTQAGVEEDLRKKACRGRDFLGRLSAADENFFAVLINRGCDRPLGGDPHPSANAGRQGKVTPQGQGLHAGSRCMAYCFFPLSRCLY